MSVGLLPFLASLGLTGCPELGIGKHILPFLAPQQTGVFCSCSNTNYTVPISSRAVVHLWITSSGHPCGSNSHLAGAELDIRRVHKYRIWSLYSRSLSGWRDNITKMPLKDNLIFWECLPVNFGGLVQETARTAANILHICVVLCRCPWVL